MPWRPACCQSITQARESRNCHAQDGLGQFLDIHSTVLSSFWSCYPHVPVIHGGDLRAAPPPVPVDEITGKRLEDIVRFNCWGIEYADFAAAPLRKQQSHSYIGECVDGDGWRRQQSNSYNGGCVDGLSLTVISTNPPWFREWGAFPRGTWCFSLLARITANVSADHWVFRQCALVGFLTDLSRLLH
eukprot:scaffold125992_cov19-Tisochrysis_lutea.AAC.1